MQEIISIFNYYDPDQPRAIRFINFYLKFIVMLAISGYMFDDIELNIYYRVFITIGIGELCNFILKLLEQQQLIGL